MLDKSNPRYKEIELIIPTSKAEATIAWFYSGIKQDTNINSIIKFPVYADERFDCTEMLQRALDYPGTIYLPEGSYCHP